MYFQLAASYLARYTVDLESATIPVMTQPMLSVSWYRLVTVLASNSLSGTFLTVAQAAVSTPFTATEVVPPWLMACHGEKEIMEINVKLFSLP